MSGHTIVAVFIHPSCPTVWAELGTSFRSDFGSTFFGGVALLRRLGPGRAVLSGWRIGPLAGVVVAASLTVASLTDLDDAVAAIRLVSAGRGALRRFRGSAAGLRVGRRTASIGATAGGVDIRRSRSVGVHRVGPRRPHRHVRGPFGITGDREHSTLAGRGSFTRRGLGAGGTPAAGRCGSGEAFSRFIIGIHTSAWIQAPIAADGSSEGEDDEGGEASEEEFEIGQLASHDLWVLR